MFAARCSIRASAQVAVAVDVLAPVVPGLAVGRVLHPLVGLGVVVRLSGWAIV